MVLTKMILSFFEINFRSWYFKGVRRDYRKKLLTFLGSTDPDCHPEYYILKAALIIESHAVSSDFNSLHNGYL